MEITEKEVDKAKQEAYKDNEVEIVSGTPPGQKRTHTLVNRTPGKLPTPARPPPWVAAVIRVIPEYTSGINSASEAYEGRQAPYKDCKARSSY